MKKLVLAAMILTLGVSLQADGTTEKFNKLLSKLEKSTTKTMKDCNKKEECILQEYDTFNSERNALIKKYKKINPKKFEKEAKKPLDKEKKCFLSLKNPKSCFDKTRQDIEESLQSLSK